MNPTATFALLLLACISISVDARKLNVDNTGKSCNFNCNTDADCTSDCAYCFLGSCFYFPQAINNGTLNADKEDGCVYLAQNPTWTGTYSWGKWD